jgi:hypothetical protein
MDTRGRWRSASARDWYFKPDARRIAAGSPANADPVAARAIQPARLDIAMGIHRLQEMTTLDPAADPHLGWVTCARSWATAIWSVATIPPCPASSGWPRKASYGASDLGRDGRSLCRAGPRLCRCRSDSRSSPDRSHAVARAPVATTALEHPDSGHAGPRRLLRPGGQLDRCAAAADPSMHQSSSRLASAPAQRIGLLLEPDRGSRPSPTSRSLRPLLTGDRVAQLGERDRSACSATVTRNSGQVQARMALAQGTGRRCPSRVVQKPARGPQRRAGRGSPTSGIVVGEQRQRALAHEVQVARAEQFYRCPPAPL